VTPAQVARNAAAVRNLAERLTAWGLSDPEERAEFIALNLATDGWQPIDRPTPGHVAPAGPGSTDEARRAARALYANTIAERRAAQQQSPQILDS
jgi:hypothetical protein